MATHDSPTSTTRVALYARVSTLNGQDPEMQLRELREYAGRRGWTIAGEYVDQGVSGAKDSRPALNRLMTDVRQRRADAVLVWKLDRFGRSLKHLVNAIADLEALGVAFVSLRDNLDLTTPSGRLMFQIIGAMAEFERALIQERVRASLRNARAKGKRLGARAQLWILPELPLCALQVLLGGRSRASWALASPLCTGKRAHKPKAAHVREARFSAKWNLGVREQRDGFCALISAPGAKQRHDHVGHLGFSRFLADAQ